MDRDWVVAAIEAEAQARSSLAQATAPPVLPSRADALGLLRAALALEAGPVLITGEAGAGKTWLWRQLALDGPWRLLPVDLAPGINSQALYRLIGSALGLGSLGQNSDARPALANHLRERAEDGRRWVLVLDEAHTLADAVLDEVRVLSNRLGQPDGFAGLVLVGQTSLVPRLATRALEGLQARLAARIHLLPIDADEAQQLLSALWPTRAWGRREADLLHRDSAGNVQRLLRLAQRRAGAGAGSLTDRSGAEIRPAVVTMPPEPPVAAPRAEPMPAPAAITQPAPLLGPARPPIVEEDGLIEVGWEPTPAEADDEPEPLGASVSVSTASRSGSRAVVAPAGRDAGEELVNDHYAALQAWNEWAQNQGRTGAIAPLSPGGLLPADLTEAAEEELKADGAPALGGSQVWADGPDSFAPYSQLFSRLRPSKDAG